MNRIRTSIAIMIMILLLCISSSLIINNECRKLSETLSEVTAYIERGDPGLASSAAQKLEDQWKISRKHLSFFVDLSCLESAGECAVLIRPLAESECDEALAQSKLFEYKLRQISRREIPFIYNIL